MKKYDVIVIGAGAAGLIAAGRAAECGKKVLLLEKMERAGRKLLITGKGRCNITNESSIADYSKQIYPNPRFLKHAFNVFFAKDIVKLFNDLSVETVVERGDRVFPVSNSAADVVNALLKWVSQKKVEVKYDCKVEKILVHENIVQGVEVMNNGRKETIETTSVIITTGGNSYQATGSNGDGYRLVKNIGHHVVEARPALVPIITEGNVAPDLQGLSLKNVTATVWVNGKKAREEFGEMLFAHYGLTGPIILTLSRLIVDELQKNNKVEVSIDLKPALDEQKLDIRLQRDLNEHGKKRFENIFKEWLPSKMIPVFIELTGIDPNKECNQVSSKERRKILLLMKELRFKVTGNRSFKEAIITAGGIDINEIDSKTMQSKLVKGLFFAGEVLDVDANTGGYNLQIAWSTGWLAGQSC